MRKTFMNYAAVFVLLAFGCGGAAAATTATSPCKGLMEDACQANASCSWVKARKTDKGKETRAYCRKKPTKTKATAAKTKE